MQPAIPREGSFASGDFAGVLHTLVRQLVDGRLDVLCGDAKRTLWMEAGQVRAVASEVEDEKLGRWLVARGFLQPHQMALALLRQPDTTLYGRQLVEEGALDLLLLQQELEARAVALLQRMLFAEGSFWFALGEKLNADFLGFEMTTASLLAAAVRGYQDLGRLETLIDGGKYLWAGQDALLLYQKVNLTPPEAFLLSRIDGTTTADRLARLAPLPGSDATRAIAALVVAGVVEVHGEPAVKPQPPPDVDLPQAVEADAANGAMAFSPEQQREFEEIVRLSAEIKHRDFYRRLGLNAGALLDQVHGRFRELTRAYHPDRAREPHLRPLRRELAEITTAVQEAYNTLADPERRTRYDQTIKGSERNASEHVREEDRRQRARKELVAANVRRARELIRIGDIGMAVQLLDQAVRFDPDPETLLMLAHLEFRNPMWVQRGLDRLRRAVTVAPKCTEAWLELANFWAVRGKIDKQRQCLDRILEYDPANEDVLQTLKGLDAKSRKKGR